MSRELKYGLAATIGPGDIKNAMIADGAITPAKTALTDIDATTGQVAAGAITDAKVNASAAVAYSKLNIAGSVAEADLASALSRVKSLYKTITNVYLENSVALSTLASFTVPGGSLGTDKVIKGRLYIYNQHATGGGSVMFRFKYGGAVIATVSLTPSSATTKVFTGYLEIFFSGSGATNTQEGFIVARLFNDAYDVSVSPSLYVAYGGGTGAIDSTVDQTFAVEGQMGAAAANNVINCEASHFELIK